MPDAPDYATLMEEAGNAIDSKQIADRLFVAAARYREQAGKAVRWECETCGAYLTVPAGHQEIAECPGPFMALFAVPVGATRVIHERDTEAFKRGWKAAQRTSAQDETTSKLFAAPVCRECGVTFKSDGFCTDCTGDPPSRNGVDRQAKLDALREAWGAIALARVFRTVSDAQVNALAAAVRDLVGGR